jgi:hypothetical protein
MDCRVLVSDDNGSLSSSWTFRSTALASRDVFAKTPPFGEGICCLAGFLGDSCHLGCNPGLDGRAKSREIVGDLRTILGRNFSHLSESRSGLIIGEFPILSLPPRPVLRRGTIITIWVFFFHDPFLSELYCGLVSVRRARYRLVWPFSFPVDSPRDQHGRSCSRNRGLRFEIRADNGRVSREG